MGVHSGSETQKIAVQMDYKQAIVKVPFVPFLNKWLLFEAASYILQNGIKVSYYAKLTLPTFSKNKMCL